MIQRVLDEEKANYCDKLLTKLIQDERQYDENIDSNFVVNDFYRNVIKDDRNYLLCYIENDVIVGYIYVKYIKTDEEEKYSLDALYVEENNRRQGIASKLIQEALNTIKSTDINCVEVNALFDNKKAINLYKKYGFNEFKVIFRQKI